MKTYFLTADGHGFTPDGTIPAGAVACTLDQINSGCFLLNGEIAHHTDKDRLKAKSLEKIQELERAAQNEICAGFVSDALGSQYIYPSGLTDQQNLTANVMSSVLPNSGADWFTDHICADIETNTWAYRKHTAQQIQAVGDACKSHILRCLVRLNELRQIAVNCDEVAKIDEIQW